MKTVLLLAAISMIFNYNSIAQRNTGTDRTPPGDRIDRTNDGNPVRNPDPKREPIEQPYREKINPTRPSHPQMPGRIDPEYFPHPKILIEDPAPYRPEFDPRPTIIIDTEPRLEDLSIDEVYILGIQNLDGEIYNQAIKCFNILLDDDPLNYEYYCLRGRAYHGIELYDRAIKDYQKAIKIEKNYADAYYYLGLTEIYVDDIDSAIVDFQIAADLGNLKAKQLMKKYFSR